MTYIILAAGKGETLRPLTLNHPKTLYRLDQDTTVLQRLVRSIRKYDIDAEIVAVVGFMYKELMKELNDENVIFVHNPFYEITNSIASLWFAKNYLNRDDVTILNGDIVLSESLVKEIICNKVTGPTLYVDTHDLNGNNWKVQIIDQYVCVMSKSLVNYYAKYACFAKFDALSSRLLKDEIEHMINDNMFDLYVEDSFVKMIFEKDFELSYVDIKEYEWVEINTVDDLLLARQINKE